MLSQGLHKMTNFLGNRKIVIDSIFYKDFYVNPKHFLKNFNSQFIFSTNVQRFLGRLLISFKLLKTFKEYLILYENVSINEINRIRVLFIINGGSTFLLLF